MEDSEQIYSQEPRTKEREMYLKELADMLDATGVKTPFGVLEEQEIRDGIDKEKGVAQTFLARNKHNPPADTSSKNRSVGQLFHKPASNEPRDTKDSGPISDTEKEIIAAAKGKPLTYKTLVEKILLQKGEGDPRSGRAANIRMRVDRAIEDLLDRNFLKVDDNGLFSPTFGFAGGSDRSEPPLSRTEQVKDSLARGAEWVEDQINKRSVEGVDTLRGLFLGQQELNKPSHATSTQKMDVSKNDGYDVSAKVHHGLMMHPHMAEEPTSSAYHRVVSAFNNLIDKYSEQKSIKSKLKTFFHFKVDGEKIEDILKHLPDLEGVISPTEYSYLEHSLEEKKANDTTYPDWLIPEPPPIVGPSIPKQNPKKVIPSVTIKPSEVVSHPVITAQDVKERGIAPPPPVYVETQASPRSLDERMSEAVVKAQRIEISPNAAHQFLGDQYAEPIGPVHKKDLSPEESKKIEDEMRFKLDATREAFAVQEAEYKTQVREGKKMFRSVMERLGVPGKQRPPIEKDVKYTEAEEAYLEAKWNLKHFISGRNVKEVEESTDGSALGLEGVRNKKIDIGVFEQAEKEYRALQDRLRELTPEREKLTIEKCFEKWNSIPLTRRIALSSALLAVGGVAFGTVGVSGALAGFGWRVGRALVGTSLGLEGGRRYGNAKNKEVKEKREEYLNEYGSKRTLEKADFLEEEKGLERFFEKEKKEVMKNQIKKGLITSAIAGVSTVGLGMGAQAVMGESIPSGAKVSGDIDTIPKPKVSDANTVSTKSWFDKFFTADEPKATKPALAPSETVPQKVDIPFEIKGYEPVGVELSDKGFIDTVAQLKQSLQGHSMSPAVEKLLAQSPEKIAMDLGLYKPGQVAESALGFQGEELTMNINGDIALMHNDGSVNILFDASGKAHPFGEYTGNTMFDGDNYATSPVSKDVTEVVSEVKPSAPVEAIRKPVDVPIGPEMNANIESSISTQSVVADNAVVASALSEVSNPKTVNFELITAPGTQYTTPEDMVLGKLPLKPEYQFDPKFKAERTAYNIRLEKELMNIPQDMFDLRYPIEYNGGRINVFQKGDTLTILLNGQRIGTGKVIDGQPGLQYEASLGKGMFGVKSDFEQAFEKAREAIEKNKMFFKVKQ